MKETRIIINCTENAEVKITAEQNFNPLFFGNVFKRG